MRAGEEGLKNGSNINYENRSRKPEKKQDDEKRTSSKEILRTPTQMKSGREGMAAG